MTDNLSKRVDPAEAIKNMPQVSALLRPQRYKASPLGEGVWEIMELDEHGHECSLVANVFDHETASTVAMALDDKYYEDQLPHELPSNVSMYIVFQPDFDTPPRQYHGDWRDHVPQAIRHNWVKLSWSAKWAVLWMAYIAHLEDLKHIPPTLPPSYDKET